jgi:hypothetical protein
MTADDRMLHIASRAGITGTLDPYINLIASAKYRNEAAAMIGGPVIGKIMHDGVDAVRTHASSANSDHTNSAERKLAQSFYDLVVTPAATLATLPLPAVVRTPAIQAIKLGEVRGAAGDEMAGPRRTSSGPHYGRPERPEQPSRR